MEKSVSFLLYKSAFQIKYIKKEIKITDTLETVGKSKLDGNVANYLW